MSREIDVSAITKKGIYEVYFKDKRIDVVRKKGTGPVLATCLDALAERDGLKCRRCGKTENLTVDHIVPKVILSDMGVSEKEKYADYDNMEILCKVCNTFKGRRLDFSDPRTKEQLLKYLQNL